MTLVDLGLYFSLLSLISVGGLPAVIPDMQRYVVDVRHWVTLSDFLQMFAIGQAAPGPNVLVSGLIGWKAAGISGAVVALTAVCGPAGVVAFLVADVWDRLKGSPWRSVAQRAMAPMVVGLMLSGGVVLVTPGGVPDWRLWLIAAASAGALLGTRLNPLWLLGAGGIAGGLLF